MRTRSVPRSWSLALALALRSTAPGPVRMRAQAPRRRPRGRRARSPPRQAVSGGSPTRTTSPKRDSSSRRCPPTRPERARPAQKLLHYLLDPVLALNPATLKREVRDLENDDVYDVIFDSFRDALALYEPAELWSAPPRIPEAEQRLLRPAGGAGGGAVLAARAAPSRWRWRSAALTHDGARRADWRDRLDQVVRWTEEASASRERGPRKSTSAIDVLEGALGDWPAPAVVRRLDALYLRTPAAGRVGHAPARPAANRRAGRSASCCSPTATRSSARSSAWAASTCARA